MWLGVWAFIPWGIIWAISMYFAFKVEKVKKDNDVQSYKEIVAFSEGKLLDDIQKQREIGKRPYQKILLVIGSMLITFTVCVLISFLMHVFFELIVILCFEIQKVNSKMRLYTAVNSITKKYD